MAPMRLLRPRATTGVTIPGLAALAVMVATGVPAMARAQPNPAANSPEGAGEPKDDPQKGGGPPPRASAEIPPWLGEELPLALSAETPQEIELKKAAERQFRIFNLLATGKLAWDQGDYDTAAQKWQALLAVPGLDPQVDRAVRPLADLARAITGGAPPPAGAPPSPPGKSVTPLVSVMGRIALEGGGVPDAAVWLKRAVGRTPAPTPGRPREIKQTNKTFTPVVTVVPIDTTVAFTNEDPVFHNVFSLSSPNAFDGGVIKAGDTYRKTFTRPGQVMVQCNLHTSPPGFIVVVDTPWFGQSSPTGHFTIRGVPPGAYLIETWHVGSNEVSSQRITVGEEGLRNLEVKAAASRRAATGKPDRAAPGPL